MPRVMNEREDETTNHPQGKTKLEPRPHKQPRAHERSNSCPSFLYLEVISANRTKIRSVLTVRCWHHGGIFDSFGPCPLYRVIHKFPTIDQRCRSEPIVPDRQTYPPGSKR